MKNLINIISTYLKNLYNYKKTLLPTAIGLAIILYIIGAFFPEIVGQTIDLIVTKELNYTFLIQLSIKLILLISIFFMLNVLFCIYTYKGTFVYTRKESLKFIKKILSENPAFFLKFNQGLLITRFNDDINEVSAYYSTSLLFLCDSVIMSSVYLIFLLKINFIFFIVGVITFPVMAYVFLKFEKKYIEYYDANISSSEVLREFSTSTIGKLKTIRAYNLEDMFTKKYIDHIEKKNKAFRNYYQFIFLYTPLQEFYSGVLTVLYFLIGSSLIRSNVITIGQMVQAILLVGYLKWPAIAFSDMVTKITSGHKSIQRLNEIYEFEDKKTKDDNKTIDLINEIEFKNFSFSFDNENDVLKNINIKIKSGEKIGLVGSVGSGKSTLIRFFVNPTENYSGSLKINGIEFSEINKNDLYDKIAYVSQEHFMYSITVKENIKFFRDISDEKVLNAVKLADLEKDLKTLPNGIDSLTGEMGIILSGGQKQRISLSRSIAEKRELMLLDDCLSAIDSKTEENIVNQIFSTNTQQTIILSSHRLNVFKNFDYIYVLEKGRIIEEGNFDTLIKTNGVFYDMYQIQNEKNKVH